MERRPEFDVVIVESGGEAVRVETEILDLPGGQRVVPNPLPQSGELEFRPLARAAEPYTIAWSKIRGIRLWEAMLLDEAIRLTKAGDFAQAFEYFQYLHEYYPRLAGLEEATQAHLVQEARRVYLDEHYAESLFILAALHERNPQHPALASAVPVVSDKLIEARWNAGDYAGARRTLEQLQQTFAQVPLKNVEAWKGRFVEASQRQMQRGRSALEQQDYAAARQAVRAARDILPTVDGAAQLLAQIHEMAPEMRVGVAQFGRPGVHAVPTLADARIARLTTPTLVELAAADADAAASATAYIFRYGTITTGEEDLQTTLRLDPAAIDAGLSPEAIALRVVETAAPHSPYYQPAIAGLLDHVVTGDGNSVFIRWTRPTLRPAALLQTPLEGLVPLQKGPGAFWHSAERVDGDVPAIRYGRLTVDPAAGPRYVIERKVRDDQEAVDLLLAGEIDVIDRLPPWQRNRLSNVAVGVGQYALPTVHVLTVNWDRPILRIREFRRALCFAIDREAICRDVLLGGEATAGFRALSGPFPAGLGATDPIAYAYKQELEVRPYEPSLARALVGMAQATVQKQSPSGKQTTAAETDAEEANPPPADAADADAAEGASSVTSPADAPLAEPLVLLHGADPLERLACQSIKLYLDQIGVRITLRELQPDESPAETPHDLHYLELAVWEPLVDARPLLGAEGVAGRSTAYMNSALTQLEQASNWNEATRQLKEIHEIAHYDLPLIPLWQTYNYFAYLESLEGVGRQPLTLYEHLTQWDKDFAEAPAP